MNTTTIMGMIIIAILAIGGLLYYQAQSAARARAAYNQSLGGAISNTIGGVGAIVGAAVGLADQGDP